MAAIPGSTATGAKRELGWWSDTEINPPAAPPTPSTGVKVAVPKAGNVPPTPTPIPTPYTGAQPDLNKIKENAATTAANSPTVPVNYAPAPETGMSSVSTPTVTTPTVNTPTVNTQVPQQGLYQDPFARSREDIAKLAADRIAKILQAGRTSASGALTGAKNAYDYTNQIEGESRNIRNASFKESNNPFGGGFGYLANNMLRNDNIQDTAQDKDYNAQVGLINQKLADLEAAAPGDEQAIIDQLEQIERQTGISVADLQEKQKQNLLNQSNYEKNFNYNAGQDKIQNDRNATNDAINNYGQTLTNQLNELKLGNYATEVKQQAQLFEQQLKAGQIDQATAEFKLGELKNPNSPVNQAAKIDLQLKQLELKYAEPEAKARLAQIKKQTAQIGAAPYKSQADRDMDEQQLIKIKAEIAKIEKGTESEAAKIDPKDSTDNRSFYYEQITSRPNLTKQQRLDYASSNRAGMTDVDYRGLVEDINKMD